MTSSLRRFYDRAGPLVGVPKSALGRIRWLFLLMSGTSSVAFIGQILTDKQADHRQLAGLVALFLIGSSLWLYKTKQPFFALDLVDCLALAIATASVRSFSEISSLFYPTLFFTSLFGTRNRVIWRTAMWLGGFIGGAIWSGDHVVETAQIPAIFIIAAVMHILVTTIQSQERSIAYQKTLAWAAAKLVGATERIETDDIVLTAAHRLAGNAPEISACLSSAGSDGTLYITGSRGIGTDRVGQALVSLTAAPEASSDSTANAQVADMITAPVVVDGVPIAAISLISTSLLQQDTRSTLDTLAGQMALSIESMAATERFRALVRHAHDVIIVVAPDGHVSYQSPSFMHLTGKSAEAAVGQSIESLLHPADIGSLQHRFNGGSSDVQLPLRFRHDDGSWRQTETIVTDLLDEPSVRGWVLNARDVSDRAALEIELRNAQKLEAVGRLAAGVAHEINTPIQFIGDNLRFMSEAFHTLDGVIDSYQHAAASNPATDVDFVRSEIPSAIDQSLDGVSRVAAIVRAMKVFAHLDSGVQESADLNDALENTLTMVRSEVNQVATVRTDFGEIPQVRCYRGDLNQVFLNLLVNAAHAVAARPDIEGIITVRTWQHGEDVLISVADNGEGISEEIKSKIFDPFFTTKDVGQGTGQGLVLAKAVIKRHGGSLTFESEPGVGSTFVIRLPMGGNDADADQTVALVTSP